MPHRKMSNEEQRVQHETVSNIDNKVTGIDDKASVIDMKVSDLLKIGKIVIPLLVTLIGAVFYIGYKAIDINDWNKSLVKQDQLLRYQIRQLRQDSIQNAKLDTLDKNKIAFKDLKAQASNRKRASRNDLKGVTARKDEYGNIIYTGVY